MNYQSTEYPKIKKSIGLTTIEYGNNDTGRLTYLLFLKYPYVQKRRVIIEKIKIPHYTSIHSNLGYNSTPSYSKITGGYSNAAIIGYSTSKYHSLLK